MKKRLVLLGILILTHIFLLPTSVLAVDSINTFATVQMPSQDLAYQPNLIVTPDAKRAKDSLAKGLSYASKNKVFLASAEFGKFRQYYDESVPVTVPQWLTIAKVSLATEKESQTQWALTSVAPYISQKSEYECASLAMNSVLMLRQNDYPSARTFADQALSYTNASCASWNARAHFVKGIMLYYNGDADKAEGEIKIGVQKASPYYDFLPLSDDLINFKTVTDKFKNSPTYYLHLAAGALNRNDTTGAKKAFDQALKLDSNFLPAYIDIAHNFSGPVRYQYAMIYYAKAQQIDPTYAPAFYNMGKDEYYLYTDFKNDPSMLEAAAQNLKRAIDLEPTQYRAYNMLGLVEWVQGNNDVALADYSKAVDNAQAAYVFNYTHPYNNIALIYAARGNYALAEQMYKKALDENPDDAAVLANMGDMYLTQEKNDLAMNAFYKAHTIYSDVSYYALGVASSTLLTGQYDLGIEVVKETLRVNTTHADLYNTLGALYTKKGMTTEASDAYSRAAQYEPKSYADQLLNLAEKEAAIKEYYGAEVFFEQAIELNPTAVAYEHLGAFYTKRRLYKDAYLVYMQAAWLYPDRTDFVDEMTYLKPKIK